jgi:uncharacterized protein YceH (UPF0502 family)
MSAETASPAAAQPVSLPPLSLHERRVLGVLIEKAKTTPDIYPLSLNAAMTGCNQKSNRDPLLDLNDLDVEEALASCQKKGLVFKITGGRVERYKHNLYEAWRLNKVEIAVVGELLLRGPQTEGELRTRASRMEPIADLDALRAALKPLAARGLVVYLTPEGRRGTTVTHGFHAPKELERLRAALPTAEEDDEARPAARPAPLAQTPAPAPDPGKIAALESQCNTLQTELAALRLEVAELRTTVGELTTHLRGLKDALGG